MKQKPSHHSTSSRQQCALVMLGLCTNRQEAAAAGANLHSQVERLNARLATEARAIGSLQHSLTAATEHEAAALAGLQAQVRQGVCKYSGDVADNVTQCLHTCYEHKLAQHLLMWLQVTPIAAAGSGQMLTCM